MSGHIGNFCQFEMTEAVYVLVILITIIYSLSNHHQQTVQRWWKDHFLGVMFPHPLSNQCVITIPVIIVISRSIVITIIIRIIIIIMQC